MYEKTILRNNTYFTVEYKASNHTSVCAALESETFDSMFEVNSQWKIISID